MAIRLDGEDGHVMRLEGEPAEVRQILVRLYNEQAEGAIPQGGRVRKIDGDANDMHPLGTLGTVISSHDLTDVNISDLDLPPDLFAKLDRFKEAGNRLYGYFIAWDGSPVSVFTMSWKIEEVSGES